MNMFDYIASRLSTWHVISPEGITLAVLATETEAKTYRAITFDGYYKKCSIKEVTTHYTHWSKCIKTLPEFEVLRICDDTGEPMLDGWCWGDGEAYNKYKADVITSLRNNEIAGFLGFSDADQLGDDNQMLELAVEQGELLYWTDWLDEFSEAADAGELSLQEMNIGLKLIEESQAGV